MHLEAFVIITVSIFDHFFPFNFLADDDGSLAYIEVIAHAQREPDIDIVVLVITAETTPPRNQISDLRLTMTHNVFVRKSFDYNRTNVDHTFNAR